MSISELVIDTAAMTRVGSQIGSNPAGIFENDRGKRFYVKSLESLAHARNEMMAARLYQLAGAPTLTYVQTKDPLEVATEWVELDKKYIAHFDEPECRQARHWLAVHAWTANWDAAGFDGDNQGVLNGMVLTLDVGGALAFRAAGDPKGRAFGTEVNEISLLRQDQNNPHSVKLFGPMTADEVKSSIQVVLSIPDEKISTVILENGGSQKLADKMVARKASLAAYS